MFLVTYLLFKLIFIHDTLFDTERAIASKVENEKEWVCVKREHDISLYERWVRVNDSLKVRERRGEFLVDCNIKKVSDYLKDYHTINSWMCGVKKVDRLMLDSCQVVFIEIQLPWPFSNRELVTDFSTYYSDSDHCVIRMESCNNDLVINENLVRVHDFKISWSLAKLDEKKTKIVFKSFSTEPPLFPLWIQDPVLKKIFFNNLEKLKTELETVH